jgi:hypothetical protein
MLPFAYVRGQNIEYEKDDDSSSGVTDDPDSRISGSTGDTDSRVSVTASSPLSQLESVLLAGEYIIPPRENGVGKRTILIGKYYQKSYLFCICIFSFMFICRYLNWLRLVLIVYIYVFVYNIIFIILKEVHMNTVLYMYIFIHVYM